MTLSEVLARYDAGGSPSASVISKLKEAQQKFGLTEDQLSDGLDAFGKWHKNEVGRGFNSTSSDDAIVNSAVQNALNFQTDAGWKNWGLNNYSGYQVFNGAPHYADSPERIAAHKEDLAVQKAQNDKDVDLANRTSAARDSISGWYSNSYYRGDWGQSGPDWFERAIKETGQTPEAIANAVKQWNTSDYPWWGPEQRVASLLQTFGVDPAGKVNNNLLQQQQASSAQVGQYNQSQNGGNDADLMNALKVMGLAAGGFAGISGLVGAGAGVGEGALASQLAAEGSSGLGAATGVGSSGFSIPSLLGENSITGFSSGNPLVDKALTSAVKTGITGGDPLKGGLSSLVTNGLTTAIPDTGINAVDSAVNGAVGSAVGGGNPLTGALISGGGSLLNSGANSIVNSFTPNGNVNENPIEQSNTISSNNPITDNNPMIPNTGGTNNMSDEWNFSNEDFNNTIDQTWNQEADMSGGGSPFNDPTGGVSSGNGMTNGTDFDPTGGVSSSGGVTGNTATSGANNSGFWSSLLKGLTTSTGAGSSNSGLGNILGAIGTYMSGSKTSDSYAALQKALLAAGDVSQRPGAQWALGQAQKYVGPQGQADYVNGMANPIMASYAQHLPSTVAKSGDLTGAMNRSMTDMGAAISGNYNGFVNSLLGATGTTQPNAGIGPAAQAGATGINQQQTGNNALYNAAGNVASNVANSIFNQPTASGTNYVAS